MTDHELTPDETTEIEAAHYLPLDELLQLPEAALEDLVDRIPPERLRWYETVYTQNLERIYGHGEVGEEAELELIATLLADYENEKKIPVQAVGRWVKVPEKIRRHVEAGEDLPPGLAEVESQRPQPGLMVAVAGGALLLVLIVIALLRGGANRSAVAEADLTATAGAARATPSGPTPVGPTATPLALLAADRVIEKGEDLRDYYPVLLEIAPAGAESRVFVVQQKPVETADWDYSRDPDTASWVSGLVVRPVLGIPYSPDNEAFLSSLGPGDRVLLRMSTGALLEFEVDRSARVGRQDTSVFRQVAPGVVVTLLVDPAGDRLVLYGSYPPGQELARVDVLRSGELEGTLTEAGETARDETSGLTVSVLGSSSSARLAGTDLPADLAILVLDVRLQTDNQPFHSADAAFELVDETGRLYAPLSSLNSPTGYPPLTGQELAAHSDRRASLAYLIPRNLPPHLVWSVRPAPDAPPLLFALTYQPPSTLTAADLDVMVLGLEATGTAEEPETLQASVRLFNPHEQPVTLSYDDIFAIFSPVASDDRFPVGPRVRPSDWHPVEVGPEEALDLTLSFAWDGSPYLGLQVGGFQYVAERADLD